MVAERKRQAKYAWMAPNSRDLRLGLASDGQPSGQDQRRATHRETKNRFWKHCGSLRPESRNDDGLMRRLLGVPRDRLAAIDDIEAFGQLEELGVGFGEVDIGEHENLLAD